MSVWFRIAARYMAGILLAYGIVPQDIADIIANDPEVAASIGLAIMGVIEIATVVARRLGWKT